jgi:hypothetical protein
MSEVKVGDRVTVNDAKYEGDGAVAYIYGLTEETTTMIVRELHGEYHRGLKLTSVTSVEPSIRLRREGLLPAFEQINSFGEMTLTMVMNYDPGFVAYYKPDGKTINYVQLPKEVDEKELWLVVSFNDRNKLEVSKTTSPKDIEIRHIRPFENKIDILDEDGVLVGRDRDKEQDTLSEQLGLLLSSLVMQAFNPFKGTRAKCLEYIDESLGEPPTWFFDGEEMFDALPKQSGIYLCGHKGTGRIYRLKDQTCVYVDSRLSRVVKVVRD